MAIAVKQTECLESDEHAASRTAWKETEVGILPPNGRAAATP